MKKLALALSCSALFLGISASQASADEFTFTISGSVDAGSGYITAVAVPGKPGEFQVLNITGNIGGVSITNLVNAGTFPVGAPNDNLLFYPAAAQSTYNPGVSGFVDINGISFALQGQGDYNLYYGSFGTGYPVAYNLTYGANLEFNDVLGGFTLVDISLPTAGTPEPSSLLLLSTGALGLAGAMRRRFRIAV
ncbi:MAG: PEP-CTERM sorting domain-containing protein [Acidobacteriota bacterium]|nr:PEP-CTERM sorting domain-containing protein [Acidobacteriota bacterium]